MIDEVPVPPPGPGVRAPFAAPPTERDRKRLWIGLGIGAALLVLCCGGGIVGFGALVVAQNRALPREAVSVVDTYLRDLRDENYRGAYEQLCGQERENRSLDEFTVRQRAEPAINGWQIGQPRIGQSAVFVPVSIDRSDGGSDSRDFTLVEDQQAGGLRICGGE
jgi:hypothetical protein